MDPCSDPLGWNSFGQAGTCGRHLWSTLLVSVSRAVLSPGSATTNDYVLTVLLFAGAFYLFLFCAGALRAEH